MLFQKLLDKLASILIGASSLLFAIIFFIGGRDLVLIDQWPFIQITTDYLSRDLILATKWLLLAMSITAVILIPIYRRVQKSQWATIAITLLFAGVTVFINNEKVFMWRSTITNTAIGLVLFGLYFLKKAPLEALLGRPLELKLPRELWIKLNLVWGIYMFICAIINTIFVLFFSEEVWVAVKTFGIPGLGVVFMGSMFAYLFQQDKRLKQESEELNKEVIE